MTAYILQMLFFALTIFSVAIMVIMILKDVKATKKQWFGLFLPILLLFMTIAYRFDWNVNTTSDLHRWFQDMDGLRRYGFDYEMRFADEFSWFWRVISYVFAHVDNLHWFPVFAVAVDFGVYFYILSDMAEEKRFAAYEVLCTFLIRLAFMPLIMTISASRNVLAYSFFALGYYMYYKRGLKNPYMYIWMLLGVLTHSTVFLAAIVFVASFFVQRYKKAAVLFLLIGILFATVLAPMLAGSSNEMFSYFGERWDVYISDPNNYDAIKASRIVVILISLFILMALWYMSKERSVKKEKTSYIVTNMASTIGVYAYMPELFLRMCYPTAMLFPVLWGEWRSSDWINPKRRAIYTMLLLAITVLAFVVTRALWVYEIYWFFEI